MSEHLDILALWYGMVWYGMVWYGWGNSHERKYFLYT